MARSDLLLESMISYYSTLGMDAVALWRSTREDIRNESLDCKVIASRMTSWWSDAVEGWWSSLLANGTPVLPVLFLSCRADSSAHSNYLKIAVPGTSDPRITPIVRVGTGEPLAAKADVEITHFRDQITVKLIDLKRPAAGTYQAIVHLDERPLVQVIVDIQGGSPPPSDNSRAPNPPRPTKKKNKKNNNR